MDAVISKLFGWMDKFSADKKPMDLDLYFAYMSVDMVGELFFSRQFGYLDQGKDIKGSIAASKSLEGLATMVGYFHWLYFLIVNPFTTWLGVLPTGYVYDNVAEAVTKRLKNPDARFDGLALWLKTHQDSPERLSLRELYATSTLVVQAGAGTVSGKQWPRALFIFQRAHTAHGMLIDSTKLPSRVSCIIPSAIQSLGNECVRSWQKSKSKGGVKTVWFRMRTPTIFPISSEYQFCKADVNQSDTKTSGRACIKEAFRFFGPLGMGLQRVVPEQGLVIGDCKFAPDTVLSIHAT